MAQNGSLMGHVMIVVLLPLLRIWNGLFPTLIMVLLTVTVEMVMVTLAGRILI